MRRSRNVILARSTFAQTLCENLVLDVFLHGDGVRSRSTNQRIKSGRRRGKRNPEAPPHASFVNNSGTNTKLGPRYTSSRTSSRTSSPVSRTGLLDALQGAPRCLTIYKDITRGSSSYHLPDNQTGVGPNLAEKCPILIRLTIEKWSFSNRGQRRLRHLQLT